MFRSIRWSLQMWHAAILATVLAAFGWVVFQFVLKATTNQQINADVNRVADRITYAVRFQPPNGLRNPGADLQTLSNALNSGNLSAAKEAFEKLQRDMPGPGRRPWDRRNRPRDSSQTETADARNPNPRKPGAPATEAEAKTDADARGDAIAGRRNDRSLERPPERMGDRFDVRLELADDLKPLFEEDAETPYYYVVWRGDGGVALKSKLAPVSALQELEQQPEVRRGRHEPPVHLVRQRGEFRESLRQSRGTHVLVGRSVRNDMAALHEKGLMLAAAGLSVLAAGLMGGHWFSKRAIKPIAAISAAAAEISLSNLSRRIDMTGTETELSSLARTLNQMFERLEASFAQQVQFTADASHELRTPLAVILSHTELALGKPRSGEELRETIETCRRSALRMKSLVESLLTLARFDSGELQLECRTFDVSKTAGDCAALVRPLAEQRKISIHLDLPPTNLVADPERISQVITNLLTNAIRYNHERGQVSLRVASTDRHVSLFVSDTGIGIPAEHVPLLFERFYRVDTARSRKDGALGLGLAICRSIVEAHGGRISVTSIVDRGTTFEVRIQKSDVPDAFRTDRDSRQPDILTAGAVG